MLALHLHLLTTMPGLASHPLFILQIFDAEHMRYVQARSADYIERSHDPGNADAALDAVPSRDEIAGCVERLRNHKAGSEEGIVNEMLKYGGPALLDMLAGLVETLWTTELVPRGVASLEGWGMGA